MADETNELLRQILHTQREQLAADREEMQRTDDFRMPPAREKPQEVIAVDRDQVVVRSYVGGLVKSFERRAA